GYLGFAGAIGRRLGEVHGALAAPTDDPAFAPEPATARDTAVWAESAIADLNSVLNNLAARDHWDNPETQTLAQALIDQRRSLLEAVRRLGAAGGAVLRTRVHGDF